MVSTAIRRPRTLAALGAAALVASVLLPATAATAAPLTGVHTFDVDAEGWTSYANAGSVTTAVADGAFCADVTGGVNAWDIAVQHADVEFVEGTAYTLSFDAFASRAVSVPLQAGGDWPDVFGSTLAVTTASTPFTFDFTPEFSAPTGAINFQLGGQAEPYRFCIDNISMTSAADSTELLPQTTFADGKGVWNTFGATAETQVGDALCLSVPAQPGGNPWDAGLVFNGVPVEQGANYVLALTASATPATPIRMIVGEGGGAYRTVLEQTPPIGTDTETISFPFTASATFPADGAAPGQVALHLGGKSTAYEFCVTGISLKTSAAPPPPYSPETGPRVRVNQVGYLPDAPKRATLVTDATSPVPFELRAGATVVTSGQTAVFGADDMSGLNVHTIDFTDVTAPGDYTLVADGEESHPFRIGADLYQQLRYDALNYFYLARSGTDIKASIVGDEYAREAGHLNDPAQSRNDTPNKGDFDVPCLTAAEDGNFWSYGDWTCPEGYALDVIGGWYDAGDHGKYVVNGGISLNQVMGTYERTKTAPTATEDALGDGSLNVPETGNGVPDVLDEARWQLDFMMSMQVPEGFPLAGLVHHKIHDLGWTGLPLLPADDPQQRRLHRPSTAATLNLAATAAQGARLFAEYDQAYADRLLETARVAWAAAKATPDLFAPAGAGQNGGGPYDDQEVGDEFYWAAAELFLTTGEGEFRTAVLESPFHSADIFTPSGISWGATAGLGRLALATVDSDIEGRETIRASVIAGAEKYLALQAAEGFPTPYPGKDGTYEWGSNSMVVNNQIVLATAFDLTGDRRFSDSVIEAMDYLLGRNALNISYLTDYGTVFSQNQHSRWFSNQLNPDLPHPPPGSLAGGPNSTTSTWDPTITGLYSGGNECAPAMCYVDHTQSWATNEITVNWNSAMSWVASFVADQRGGVRTDAGQVVRVTAEPADVGAQVGDTATFTASATGDPEPSVRWQSRTGGGAWVDVPGGDAATLTVTATREANGTPYRAVFENAFGTAYTDPATLTVSERTVTVTVSSPSAARGATIGVEATGLLPGERSEIWLNSTPILLGTVQADADGRLVTQVTVPQQADLGAHTVRVVGLASGAEGTAALQVVAVAVGGGGAPAATGPTARQLGATGSSADLLGMTLLGGALLAAGGFLAVRRRRLRTAAGHGEA